MFTVGQRVKCVRYGEGAYPGVLGLVGTVTEVLPLSGVYPITVRFDGRYWRRYEVVMDVDELELVV